MGKDFWRLTKIMFYPERKNGANGRTDKIKYEVFIIVIVLL